MKNEKLGMRNEKIVVRRGGVKKTFAFALLFSLCSFIFFSACQNLLEPPKMADAKTGTVELSINGNGNKGRTIMPSDAVNEFVKFNLDFVAKTNGNMDSSDEWTNNTGTIELKVGTWELTVTAYLDGDVAVAQKTVTFTIVPGTPVSCDVRLEPVTGGTGTFSWEITAGETIVGATAAMDIKPVDESTSLEQDDFIFVNTTTAWAGSFDLDAGQYRVVFSISVDGEVRVFSETLHIYNGMESCYVKTFTDRIFSTGLLTSIDGITDYLDEVPGGAATSNPVYLPVALEEGLGIMTDAGSGWQQLLGAIADAGLYVELDLSACAMEDDGVFDPDCNLSTGKSRIVSIVLPDAAESIPDGGSSSEAFRGFSNLKSVSGENIITIGTWVFYDRQNLISADFPLVTIIGDYAFFACVNFSSANFPAATNIGTYAFASCISLTTVNIPVIESIGSNAFEYCTNLASVSLPAATSIMDGSVFIRCASLTSFVLTGIGDLAVTAEGSALIRNDGSNKILLAYPSASGTITMNDITSIDISAFYYCTDLISVSFPAATNIGSSAFYYCSNLTSVNFPIATNIGNAAFAYCTKLAAVSFPAAASISSNTFAFTGTGNMVITLGNNAPNVSTNIFGGILGKFVVVMVPAGATSYGSTPMDTTTDNWGNAFRGKAYADSFYGSGIVNGNIDLIILEGAGVAIATPVVPFLCDGDTLTLSVPKIIVPAGLTVTEEGWETSDDGGGTWTPFSPPSTADMSMDGKDLRYYAKADNSETYYSNAVAINVYPAGTCEITIEMRSSAISGWYGAALRINVNGTDITPNATLTGSSGPSYYRFIIEPDDAVKLNWVKGSNDNYCIFAMYYSDEPPEPELNPSSVSWAPTNEILFYKARGSMADAIDGEELCSFVHGGLGIVAPIAPFLRDGGAFPFIAPRIINAGAAITEQGWEISDDGGSTWTPFSPPSTADMSMDGKDLRYYATADNGQTYYSYAITLSVNSADVREITIVMRDVFGDGWDGGGALRVNVNGTDLSPNARLSNGAGPGYYTFFVDIGDVVTLYWIKGSNDGENSFAVYYSDVPPIPELDSNSNWMPTNEILFYMARNMSGVTNGQELCSFVIE